MNHLIQYKLTASKAALSGGQKDSNYQLVRVCNQLPKVEVEVLTNGSLVFEVPLLFIFWHRLLSVLLKGHFSRLSQKSFFINPTFSASSFSTSVHVSTRLEVSESEVALEVKLAAWVSIADPSI